jgi:hypothetical protein
LTDGGAVYAAFIEQELKAERDRRTTLDARGQAVITTSGSLVTLLAAVGAFVTGSKDFHLPHQAAYPLVATVTMFVFAALFGILATNTVAYRVARSDVLQKMVLDRWTDTERVATKNTTALNISTVLSLRASNDKKVLFVRVAHVAQLLALLALGTTVYIIAISV